MSEIMRAYAEGVPIAGITERYGVGTKTLYRMLKAAGIPKRGADPERKRGVIARLEAGSPYGEIAREFGLLERTVADYALRWGLRVRGPRAPARPPSRIPVPATGRVYRRMGGSLRTLEVIEIRDGVVSAKLLRQCDGRPPLRPCVVTLTARAIRHGYAVVG